MKKRGMIFLIVASICMASVALCFAADHDTSVIRVILNQKRLSFDTEPTIMNGRTMLPLRAVFEALEVEVSWDDATRTVTVVKGDTTVKLTVGEATAYVNDSPVTLDQAASIVDGRTLVPLRFASESMGLTCYWDAESRTVSLASGRDTMPDTFVGIDGYGRLLPTAEEVGYPREDKAVALFYYCWNTESCHMNRDVHDITKILNGEQDFMGVTAFHYWGEPFFGYYHNADPFVIRKHAEMFADAGIDVLFFDNTNGAIYPETVHAIVDTFAEIRAEGGTTPQICGFGNESVMRQYYNEFFNPKTHTQEELDKIYDLWFQWEGKYFALSDLRTYAWKTQSLTKDLNKAKTQEEKDTIQADIDFYSCFADWNYRGGASYSSGNKMSWNWIQDSPVQYGHGEDENDTEQVGVSVAQHPHSNRGKSLVNGVQPAWGEQDTKAGGYFNEQMSRAIELDPDIIWVTQWNEWIAQRFSTDQNVGPFWDGPVYAMQPHEKGQSYFIDVYNWEFNRDLEPMRNDGDYGYGDNYYYQFVSFIRQYKGVRNIPKAGEAKTIDMAKGFADWDDVTSIYLDNVGDIKHRDFRTSGKSDPLRSEDKYYYTDANGFGFYRNDTGRNDLDTAKVSRDDENLYFYISTANVMQGPGGIRFLTLYLNTDGDYTNGWNGYDFVIGRTMNLNTKTMMIESFGDGWKATKIGDVSCAIDDTRLQVAIPKSLLGITGDTFTVDFKWTDNVDTQSDGSVDIMDFIDKGDCAPNGRYNYRYEVK